MSPSGALIMSRKTNIAALAAILSALAAPAFAGDQNLATELRNRARIFGIDYTADPQHLSGAYASSAEATHVPVSMGWVPTELNDVQMYGR
jgi:hypothetical protein